MSYYEKQTKTANLILAILITLGAGVFSVYSYSEGDLQANNLFNIMLTFSLYTLADATEQFLK